MIRFACDFCETLKETNETWILGFAAENVGVTAARREFVTVPGWDRKRAVEPLAVHFCCVECRDNYTAELFNETPRARSEKRAAVPEKHTVKVFPSARIESQVTQRSSKPKRPTAKAKRRNTA